MPGVDLAQEGRVMLDWNRGTHRSHRRRQRRGRHRGTSADDGDRGGRHRDALCDRPVLFFGFPGGGYCRHYFDLHPPGYTGYSQAEYHARATGTSSARDHLAVGDSDVPTTPLDFEVVARGERGDRERSRTPVDRR